MARTLRSRRAPRPRDPGRRFFVPIGVGRAGGAFRELEGVPGDLARMTRLFEARGYEVVPVPVDPTAAELRAALVVGLDAAAPGHADAVVVYFSGHGCVIDGDHYLCCRGFSKDRPPTTGLKTEELLELALRRRPRAGKLWLILDCCEAGAAIDAGLCRGLVGSGAEVFVVSSTCGWSEAYDGAFSRAFAAAAGGAARGASLDRLVAAVNARRPETRAVQAAFAWSAFDLLDGAPQASSTCRRRAA